MIEPLHEMHAAMLDVIERKPMLVLRMPQAGLPEVELAIHNQKVAGGEKIAMLHVAEAAGVSRQTPEHTVLLGAMQEAHAGLTALRLRRNTIRRQQELARDNDRRQVWPKAVSWPR